MLVALSSNRDANLLNMIRLAHVGLLIIVLPFYLM